MKNLNRIAVTHLNMNSLKNKFEVDISVVLEIKLGDSLLGG